MAALSTTPRPTWLLDSPNPARFLDTLFCCSAPRQGSPCILPTTAPVSYLDLGDIAALLEDGGHADLVSLETWSRDAGAYYCNEMFYRTLHAVRKLGTPSEDGSSLIPASQVVCT